MPYIEWDLKQADGRRIVREVHEDYGSFDYIAEADTDVEAKLLERAASLAADPTGVL